MSPGPNGDALEELTLQPLPLYACSSDNVTMCSVATTPGGRIFTGGANGNLYEIVYNSTDSWRKKRCYKVIQRQVSHVSHVVSRMVLMDKVYVMDCTFSLSESPQAIESCVCKVCYEFDHFSFLCVAQKDLTSSWTPYLPSLPSYFNSLLPRPSPILEIAVDAERHILYTRSQTSIQVGRLGIQTLRNKLFGASQLEQRAEHPPLHFHPAKEGSHRETKCYMACSVALQVFDLGVDGKDFRKVAEVTDFIKQAERAAGAPIENIQAKPILPSSIHLHLMFTERIGLVRKYSLVQTAATSFWQMRCAWHQKGSEHLVVVFYRRQGHLRGPQQRGSQGRSGGAHRAHLAGGVVSAALAGRHRRRPPPVLQRQRQRRLRRRRRGRALAAADAHSRSGRPPGAAAAGQCRSRPRHPAALQVHSCCACTASHCQQTRLAGNIGV